MLNSTPYTVRSTPYVGRSTQYVLNLISYEVRLTWVSLYDFPPLVAFKGRFSFRKWFCFLDLKIKNDWSFHFRYSNFQGKGNKGKYLRGSDFLGYVYKVLRCRGCGVGLAVVAVRLVGLVG